jgi:hypothetical protein
MDPSSVVLSLFLALCASQSTTDVQDFYGKRGAESLSNFTYEMPEYPPHPDSSETRSVVINPTVGRPAFGGYILGSHRGEWGGELAFRHPDGRTEVLLHEPVEAIERFAGRELAFVGLAHLGLNKGAIYEVKLDGSGDIAVEVVAELPGAPIYSGRGESGELLFLTASGRFKRNGLHAIPIFDCHSLAENLVVRTESCAKVRDAR